MSQRVHVCSGAVLGFQDLSEALRLCCFYIHLYYVLFAIQMRAFKWGGINSGSKQYARRTWSRGKSRVPAQPSSECSDRHNLFYAFNLGGLVTYIPSSHLFAFYGWTLLPSVLSAFYLWLNTPVLVIRQHSAELLNVPSQKIGQINVCCAGWFTRAINLKWNI